MTGPATPKPAASILSAPTSLAASRISFKNFVMIASKEEKLWLSYRLLPICLYSSPRTRYRARLHLVPPTSAARIIYFSRVSRATSLYVFRGAGWVCVERLVRARRLQLHPPGITSHHCREAEPAARGRAGRLCPPERREVFPPCPCRPPEKRRGAPHQARATSASCGGH